MGAGDYRRIVTIQVTSATVDDSGQAVDTWADEAKVHAAVEPLQGRELFAAQAIHSEAIVRVRIRYRGGITPQKRLLYGARVLNILSVADAEERHREITMLCSEMI